VLRSRGFNLFLDQRVGLQHCLLVLTADHGVSPMPERMHAVRPETSAGRIDAARVLAAGEDALNRTFGPLADRSRWLVRSDMELLIFPSALQEKKIPSAAAQAVVRDALGRAALLSFYPARSGDVVFQPKPYFFIHATGSTHSSPYDYDTHVPLLWYGAGMKPGVHAERVGGAILPRPSRISSACPPRRCARAGCCSASRAY
jgi:hypothetical protein